MTPSLPSNLFFSLIPTEETWTVAGPVPDRLPRVVPSPLADARFRGLVANLREWASRPVPLDRPDPLGTKAFVEGLARRISQRLTDVLLVDEDRRAMAAALAEGGRVRLVLRVRPAAEGTSSTADATLALPWELLAPGTPGDWPVRDGRLTVIREAVADGAPDLPEPAGPLTLAATIAAPEDRVAFAYEQEAFRLLAALSPLGQRAVFSDLGGLDDLVELVAAIRATAIHFRGHGLPGGLLFENALGFSEEVPVGELRRRLATILLSPRRAGFFPGLFFLAAPYTAREVPPGQGPAVSSFDEESSAAAALHRSGFAQVVGYFGPVSADLTTRLEERFYESLARGGSTLTAVELARSALDEPLGAAGERVVYPFGWTQLAVYHRGPDRPLAQPGRGTRLPARFRRRMVQVHGLPVLERGFIGRRDLLHEIRRRIHGGQRLLVLQGLGGLGKTALASHLLARIFEVKPADRLILRCQEAEEAADPVLVLRGQAEDHGRLHRFRFWDERMKDLRERFPDPVEGFVRVVRALRRDRPHLAIYADNAESLQEGPKTGDSRALGTWRPGAEAWWRALERLEAEGDGLIALTTRYLWSDLRERAWVGIGSMGPADSLRMIDSFPSLARLPREVRTRIAEQVDGHPRTVEYLDRLVAWQRRKLGRKKLRDPWRELIEPVLPKQAEQITADLLLEEIWRRLSVGARKHGKRIGVLRVPAPRSVIDGLGRARDELIRAGLLGRYLINLEYEHGTGAVIRWGMHLLVKNFVDTQQCKPQEIRQSHVLAGAAYERWARQPDAPWDEHEEAIYHLHSVGDGDRAWPLVQEYVHRLHVQARYAEARVILEYCERGGTTGDRLALALMFLARARRRQGERGADLNEVFLRALSLSQSHESRGHILTEFGILLAEQGSFGKAARALQKSLASKKAAFGPKHPAFGFSLQVLGGVRVFQGRYVEAERLMRRSLAIGTVSVELGETDFGAGAHELARVLEYRGNYHEAELFMQQSLAIKRETLGEAHPDYAASQHELAVIFDRQGRSDEAEELFRSAIDIQRESLGSSHPYLAASLHELARVLADRDEFLEAETLLEESISILESTFDRENSSLAISLTALGRVLLAQEKNEEAEAFLRKALEVEERSPCSGGTLAGTLHALGLALEEQGKIGEAEEFLRRSIALLEELTDQQPASLHSALVDLAELLIVQDRFEEAARLFRKADEINPGGPRQRVELG